MLNPSQFGIVFFYIYLYTGHGTDYLPDIDIIQIFSYYFHARFLSIITLSNLLLLLTRAIAVLIASHLCYICLTCIFNELMLTCFWLIICIHVHVCMIVHVCVRVCFAGEVDVCFVLRFLLEIFPFFIS